MKKHIITAIISTTLLLTTFTGVSLAKDPTVGLVDMQKIYETSKFAQEVNKAKKELEDAQTNYDKDTQDKANKLDEARIKKVAEAELKKMQDQFQKELENKRKEGQMLSAQKQKDLEDLEKKFKGEVDDTIKNVAKEKNIDVVVLKQAVLFGGTDITDDVIKKLK